MDEATDDPGLRAALRWRLVLGRHAEEPLAAATEPDEPDEGGDGGGGEGEPTALSGEAAERDALLAYLYDREHAARGHQRAGAGAAGLTIPAWLGGVRRLFPREACEVLERDALVRYGLTELVTDPEVLRSLEPTVELVGVLLSLRSQLAPAVREEARKVVARVVRDLADRLRRDAEPALLGARDPDHAPLRTFHNVDWPQTVRRSLSRWDPAEQRLALDRLRYHRRSRRRSQAHVILAVDQSGSMADSVVHASVVAAVLASVPAVSVRLLLWDDRVVDVSHLAHDPLEVLMAAQLGGGTALLPALRACADAVVEPDRTVLAVVSDFHVFDPPGPSLALAAGLATEGVRCFGFCALGPSGRGVYDERFARALAGAGWWVGAVTPLQLAQHVGPLLG
ncbi:MAG: VWA domain-containing protein [Myxococcota bacterium]